ncbi:AAA family ATPase [Pandoraea iniqua]|nr:AAA family ATPase [Pandoraea iniqua]
MTGTAWKSTAHRERGTTPANGHEAVPGQGAGDRASTDAPLYSGQQGPGGTSPVARASAAQASPSINSGTTPGGAPGNGGGQDALAPLCARLDRLTALVEQWLTGDKLSTVDWSASVAFHWRGSRGGQGGQGGARLVPVTDPQLISFDDLRNVSRQREVIERNTAQFVAGHPANNVLLTGARGTGKSSLVKACLYQFAPLGLRLVEVDKADLDDLPHIVGLLRARPERFVLFCDDLSFEPGESSYKGLKTALDGSVSGGAANVLVYATSNRRHLVPESASDNLDTHAGANGELHPGDAVEEKISLSERFGLWLTFYGFTQDEYLAAVALWLGHQGFDDAQIAEAREAALQWALTRGARSGRIAAQFARDYAGRRFAASLDAVPSDVPPTATP